jgi:hypothetical protein
MGFAYGDIITVKFLDKSLDLPLVPTFSYVDQGTPGLFINKSETGEFEGNLFMAINMGDFTTTYGIATKTTNPDKTWYWTACEGVTFPIVVTLEMKEQGGYLDEMLLRDITRTNNREDYPELTNKRERMKCLRQDIYYNALQVKYAYAVTCHKAQGGQWKRVFIDAGLPTDRSADRAQDIAHLRWLYTALTRATEQVYLIQ